MKLERVAIGLAVLLAAVVAVQSCNSGRQASPEPSQDGGRRLTATYRTEPGSFNRLVTVQNAVELVRYLTHDTLVRVNRSTGKLEPRLARRWTSSADGLTWTFELRDDAKFSDGASFTSADVTFTFRALYDDGTASPLADAIMIDGKPLMVRALDAATVVVSFPAPHGPGLEILSGLPILPAHRLSAALEKGTFKDAWNAQTPPADVVGLGPFALAEYVPASRVIFKRNPHFWGRDEDGRPLPYLEEIELRIVPEHNAEILQLETGEVDVTADFVPAEALKSLRSLGSIVVADAGTDTNPDSLWFNLSPARPGAKTRPWANELAFRQAVSHAIDRQAIVDAVYLGEGTPIFGPVTPGHGAWYSASQPATPFDQARARTLLAGIGMRDADGDGMLDDRNGRPVRFTVLTHKGHPARERTMALVRDHLAKVGIAIDVVGTDPNTLLRRYLAADFDAIYFYVVTGSDPADLTEFWLSSGPFHIWHPKQARPATPWEARIDELMRTVSMTQDPAERRRLFAEVQTIFGQHLPLLYLVAPTAHVAMSARVRGAQPTVFPPPVLWNAERLWLAPAGAARRP